MTIYLKIDRQKDIDWLQKIIAAWLSADPNNHRLQINFEQISAWDKYLKEGMVSAKEVIENAPEEVVQKIIPPEQIAKLVKPKKEIVEQPKRRGRPPSKASIAAAKKKEKLLAKKEKEAKQKELASDPFRCPDHPTYGGRNRLSRDCPKCWEIYKKFHPADWKQAWNALQRSLNAKVTNV